MKNDPRPALVLAVASLLPGCAHLDFPEPDPPPAARQASTAAPAAGAVAVRYLGSSGFLIRRGDTAVMTAPLFTNPFPPKYLLGATLKPRHDFIQAFVRDVNRIADGAPGREFEDDLRAVRLIVSGHAHYDHLMDVPAVIEDYMSARPPQVVTSVSGKRTLQAYGLAGLVALNEPGRNFVDFTAGSPCAAPGEGCETPSEAGAWWPPAGGPDVGRVRIFAVASEHPPQVIGTLVWPGCQKKALTKVPTRLDQFPVGEVFAFLIDLLDDRGQVAFRIYYEDAPLPPCRSEPLERQIASDRHPVDLALLCTGTWKEVKEPETIVYKLGARNVVLHHWEWFFDEKPYAKRQFLGLPGSPANEYRDRVIRQLVRLNVPDPAAHVEIPRPGVRYTY